MVYIGKFVQHESVNTMVSFVDNHNKTLFTFIYFQASQNPLQLPTEDTLSFAL